MDTTYMFVDDQRETGCALIMVDEDSAQIHRCDIGACGNITDDIEKARPLLKVWIYCCCRWRST